MKVDRRLAWIAVAAFMLLAAWLRLRGADYPASYHPDEIVYVSHSVGMALSGDFRPGWYEHATLHLTALAALYRLIAPRELLTLDPEELQRVIANPPAQLFIVARWFSVAWSVAQIPLVFRIGVLFGGPLVGLAAAGLLAITPLDVWESHFALNNQMVSFWMLVGLLGCLRVAQTGRGYMLAGVAAGLAQATRYTGEFLLLALVVAHAIHVVRSRVPLSEAIPWPPRRPTVLTAALLGAGLWELTIGEATGLTFHNFVRSTGPLEEITFRLRIKPLYNAFGPLLSALPFGLLFLAAGGALLLLLALAQRWTELRPLLVRDRGALVRACLLSGVVFLIAMPWFFLDATLVMTHIRIQMQLNSEPRFGFDRAPTGWQYQHWIYELVVGLPFSAGPGILALAIVGLIVEHRRASGSLSVMLALALSYIAFLGVGSRVFLRYLVPLMPIMSVLAAIGMAALFRAGPPVLRAVSSALVIGALLWTAAFTWSTNERFNPDTRLVAAEWIAANVEPGESIGMNTIPELSPPVDRSIYRVVLYDRTVRAEWVDPIIYLPRYLILTSAVYNRALRDPSLYDFYMDGYERVWAGDSPFKPLIRWDSPFLLRDFFTRLDPMLASYYVSPTIEIYRRR